MRYILRLFLTTAMAALSLGSQAATFSNFGQYSYSHYKETPGMRDYGTSARSTGVNGATLWAVDSTKRELGTLWPIDGGYMKPVPEINTAFTVDIGSQGCGKLSVSQKLPIDWLRNTQILQQGVGIDWSVTPTIYAGAGCASNGQVWVNAGGKVTLKGGMSVQAIVFKVAAGVYLTVGIDAELRAGPGGMWDVAPNPDFNGPINWVRFTVKPSVSGGLYGAASIGVPLWEGFILGLSLDGQLAILSVDTPVYVELGWKFVNPARTRFKFYTDNALLVNLSGGSGKLDLNVFALTIPLINTAPIWTESFYVVRNFSRPDEAYWIR